MQTATDFVVEQDSENGLFVLCDKTTGRKYFFGICADTGEVLFALDKRGKEPADHDFIYVQQARKL